MSEKKSSSWLTGYIILVMLACIRFLPFVAGTEWFWGVGQLTLLPAVFTIFWAVLSGAVIAVPFLSGSERWGEQIGEWFNRIFFEARTKYFARGAVVAAAGLLFVIFRMPTHFFGDGYTYLATLGSDSGHWVKWSEAGGMHLVMAVQSLLGAKSEAGALAAFQIVSIISGELTLFWCFAISGQLSVEPVKRLVSFAVLAISGALLLFFGYVEWYPMLWGVTGGFLYFGLKYAREGKGVIPAFLFLTAGCLLHLQLAMFVPGLIVLLVSRGKGLEIYRRYRLALWGAAGASAVVAVYFFVREFNTDLAFENIFLISEKPQYPDYRLWSGRHLADMINLLLLVFPAGLMLIGLPGGEVKKRWQEPGALFLGALSVGSLLFLILVDPGLSMPRDWDLFALCWLAPVVWLLYMSGDARIAAVKRLTIPILLVSLMGAGSFLLVNLNEQRSVEQIRQIAGDNHDKSFGTLTILSSYYARRGEFQRVDSLGRAMRQEYPDFYRVKDAFSLLAVGKQDEAYRIFIQARPDRFSKDYQSFLSAYNLRLGKADAALAFAKRAIQLQIYFDRSYALLAYAYMMKGMSDSALAALRDGYALNQKNKEFIVGLAQMSFNESRYDSTLYYAEKLRQADSTDALYYYLAAKAFAGTRNFRRARENALLYVQRGQTGSGFAENRKELEQLLPDVTNQTVEH